MCQQYRLVVAVSVFLLVGLLAACGEAESTVTAVSDNGIPIAPEFQAAYQDLGGRVVLGEPITELFTPFPGKPSVQYFQNLRLEQEPATENIYISQLGAWELGGLHEQVLAPVSETSAVRSFAHSSFTVQDEFLNFYDNHHGEILLGLPISPQLNVEGLRVQYFENGRLEWHPEAPADHRIQLGSLGQTHFDNEMSLTYQEMKPARIVSSAGITEVELSSYVKAPILYAGENQVLYATINTLGGYPVSNVVLEITLTYEDETLSFRSMPTDDLGQVTVPLDYAIPPGKKITVNLVALNGSGTSLGSTVLSYKTWW